MNPKVLDAFVLAIIGGEAPPTYPCLDGHEPELAIARKTAAEVNSSMKELRKLAPDGGAFFAESNFFEPGWQEAYWGVNYARLREIKRKYDPDGLFFVAMRRYTMVIDLTRRHGASWLSRHATTVMRMTRPSIMPRANCLIAARSQSQTSRS